MKGRGVLTTRGQKTTRREAKKRGKTVRLARGWGRGVAQPAGTRKGSHSLGTSSGPGGREAAQPRIRDHLERFPHYSKTNCKYLNPTQEKLPLGRTETRDPDVEVQKCLRKKSGDLEQERLPKASLKEAGLEDKPRAEVRRSRPFPTRIRPAATGLAVARFIFIQE